jgi:methylated-DNA-[protein]-cysteine S-methyltransferase
MPQLSLHSPVGDLTLSEEGGAIVALDWGWARDQADTPLLRRSKVQLERYFDGDPHPFHLPLAPAGTSFQQTVWRAMSEIPAGQTRSYGELAAAVGSAARAVGGACGANPIPIIVPCHRVLAAGGALGGYSGEGGIDTKVALLRLEGAIL